MLDAAAEAHMERNPGACLDTNGDFDVLLWEVPAATIRSPDAALFDGAPDDLRPLPASRLKVVVEVISPGSRKPEADKLDKMAEYADAGIPFYWLVWLSGDHALSIDVHVLDHTLGYYRLYRTLSPEQETSTIDVPIRSRSTGTASPSWFASSLVCHGGSSQRPAVDPGAPPVGVRVQGAASDGLRDDVRVIKGGCVGADIFRVAGEDLRWPMQGSGHHDEGVHCVGTLLRRQQGLAEHGSRPLIGIQAGCPRARHAAASDGIGTPDRRRGVPCLRHSAVLQVLAERVDRPRIGLPALGNYGPDDDGPVRRGAESVVQHNRGGLSTQSATSMPES
jgi:hypothetical protein